MDSAIKKTQINNMDISLLFDKYMNLLTSLIKNRSVRYFDEMSVLIKLFHIGQMKQCDANSYSSDIYLRYILYVAY